MIHILEWLFRYLIRFTIGTVVLFCLFLLALIFWKVKFISIFTQIDNLILGKDENNYTRR